MHNKYEVTWIQPRKKFAKFNDINRQRKHIFLLSKVHYFQALDESCRSVFTTPFRTNTLHTTHGFYYSFYLSEEQRETCALFRMKERGEWRGRESDRTLLSFLALSSRLRTSNQYFLS